MINQSSFIKYLTEMGLSPAEVNSLVNTINQQAQQGGTDPVFEMPDFTKIPSEKIESYKTLLKQVSCEEIPNDGFSPDDLAKVKSCAKAVTPIETEDFNPPLLNERGEPILSSPDQQEQFDQAECLASATEAAKKVVLAEQRKTPNAIKYAALRGKIQELKDNLVPIKEYFTERYNIFTNVVEQVRPYTSEFLYWEDEYTRLTLLVSSAKTTAENSTSVVVLEEIIDTLDKRSKGNYIEQPAVRNAISSLADDLSNFNQVLTGIGLDSTTVTLYALYKQSILNSTSIKQLITAIKAKVAAYSNRLVARNNALSAQAQRIQSYAPLSSTEGVTKAEIQSIVGNISQQILVRFSTFQTNEDPIAPKNTAAFSFRLIDKFFTTLKVTQYDSNDEPITGPDGKTLQADETFQIYGNPILQNNVFANRQGLSIVGVNVWPAGLDTYPSDTYDQATNSWTISRFYRDYSLIKGLLYNGISGNPYIGLYNRLAKPIKYLFTLQERGLTLDANQIDPSLAGIEGAPLTYAEDNINYYISNISNYESFYDILPVQYPIRVDRERDTVYPQTITEYLSQLRSISAREAADIFRQDPESALRLARPVSYTASPGSAVFSQGTFEYSTLDPILSDALLYYTETYNKINELISQCDSELGRLQEKIKENSMDEETLKKKLSAIPCFSKAAAATEASNQQQDPDDPNAGAGTGQEPCAKKTARKRATDPLYLKTLSGTDTSLPDITSQCYWKEFAKALNKVSILPFPDLSGPPPTNLGFRYWPISCILPVPFGMVLLPIPPVWRSLFTIPTPLGTLVCFLTFPIAPIGIPLPSIYLFFFAIDGNKYLALATNVPILYAPPTNLKFGFIQDNSSKSANPLGLVPTNPFRGQPIKGALVAPLALNAITAKARRLASLSAMIASGKPYITNLAGEKLPVDIKLKDLFNSMPSEPEQMMAIASALPTGDFSRQMDQFKITINRQLDKLGVTPIAPIQALKRQVEQKREAEEAKAFQETEPSTRRKKRKEARNIKLKNLNDKINATKQIMNAHLDNIKLGTIRYPKDPTKFNPELPSAFTALLDIIELAVTGDLKVEGSATDLGNQLTSIISKINPKSLSSKKRLNLKDPADFAEFKNALKKLTKKTVDYLGGKSFTPNTTGAKTQAEAQEIAESEKAMQDKLVKAISLTAAALAVPISLNIFDFGKKCCDVQAQNVLSTVPLPVQLAFTLITSLLESLIDALTPSAAIKTLGLGKNATLDISQVGTMLEKMIQQIPKVKLPDPASIQIMIMALIIPILSIISLPKAPAPLHLPTIPIIVPLDPILKPLIKKALGAVVDGSFKLLDSAGNAVLAAELAAKAEAGAQAAASGLRGNGGGTGAGSGAGSGTGGTGIGTGVGTGTGGQQTAGTGTSGGAGLGSTSAAGGVLNSTISSEYSASEKIVKQIFKTACGDTGITATLALESRIELTEILNTINDPDKNINELLNQSAALEADALNKATNPGGNYEGYQNSLRAASAQFSQSFEATSKSKVILSIETPDGERFDLPEMPFAALDIGGNFDLLTGADIVEMIRSIINAVFDKLIKPIATIVDIISLLSLSLNTFSYTTIEAGIPYVNIIKLILMAIDAIIPAGIKLKSANLEAMELIKNTLIKGLLTVEPVLKEITWIVSLALCAFSSTVNNFSFTTIARLFHPIMNQDDLPPWERLTHKNPLFAIFLDEIAWRGSLYATGSLIFQSKTPAVLPYSPLYPIVHIPIHTVQPN